MTKIKEEIIALERGFWESANNPEFYRDSMTDNAISVMEPMGFISKDRAVAMSEQGEAWTDLKMDDIQVAELAPDCAAIAYHGEAKGSKTGKPYRATISSVYVRSDGNWKMGMTVHQSMKTNE
jgi:hypothetical protein